METHSTPPVGREEAAVTPSHDHGEFLYFAYGSNLSIGRITSADRAPSAVVVNRGQLQRHALRFNKKSDDGSTKANAHETGNDADAVQGVVYRISDKDRGCLDFAEGVGRGYRRMEAPIALATGGDVVAVVYVADGTAMDEGGQPYDWYRDYVLEGANEHHLDAEYIHEFIESVVPKADPNESQHNRDEPCPHRDADARSAALRDAGVGNEEQRPRPGYTVGRRAKKAGRLIGGFEYQHHVGAWYLLELLGPDGATTETLIEADDRTNIDDVVQRRRDGSEFIQVKWGADEPPKDLSIGDLIDGGAKSVIARLASGWSALTKPARVTLWTNKSPDEELSRILDGQQIRRSDALSGDSLSSRQRLQAASGLDLTGFDQFTDDLDLRVQGPDQNTLALRIERRLTEYGHPRFLKDRLLEIVREAAVYGRKQITRSDLAQQLGLGPQQELTEEVPLPEFGYIARPEPESALLEAIRARSSGGFVVLLGQPGSGKTALIKHVVDALPTDIVLVARHYVYIPRIVSGRERAQESSVLETLLAQIQRNLNREELRVTPEAFRRSLEEIGARLRKQGQVGAVVIDALDELADYRSEPVPLLDSLIPETAPPGIVFLLSAQNADQITPRLRRHASDPIAVGPLEPADARRLLLATNVQAQRTAGGRAELTDRQIAGACERAGGSPLLVILLGRRLATAEDVDAALAEEPSSDGDVRRTFAALWDRASPNARYILAALSAADEPLTRDDLREAARITEPELHTALMSISHVLTETRDGFLPYARFLARFVETRDSSLVGAAASRLADVFGAHREAPRTIRSLWQLLDRASRGTEVIGACNEDTVDEWLYLGVPLDVIRENIRLAVAISERNYPSPDFDRLVLLRAIVAQRFQDLDDAQYIRGLMSVLGSVQASKALFIGTEVHADRGAAATAALALWNVGNRSDAVTLALHAVRPAEEGESHFAMDDDPSAIETLVMRGVRDFDELVTYHAGRRMSVSRGPLLAVARGARRGKHWDRLLELAERTTGADRRRIRRAVVVAALDDEALAKSLGTRWRDDLVPTRLADDRLDPDDGWDLELVPTLAIELSEPERRAYETSSLAGIFLRLRDVAIDVRAQRRPFLDLIEAIGRERTQRPWGPSSAVRDLVRWAAKDVVVRAEDTDALAAAALRAPNALIGSLGVVEALTDVARFEDPERFISTIESGLSTSPEEAYVRFSRQVLLSRLAAANGSQGEAERLLRLGIRAHRGYGWHKDIAFELVVDSMRRAYSRLPELAEDVVRWTSVLEKCAELLPYLTDMDEHRGTLDDVRRLRANAESRAKLDRRDHYWSEREGVKKPDDWRETLDHLFSGDLDSHADREAELREWLKDADERGCAELADELLKRRGSLERGWSGDRLFGEVVRREIALGATRWREDAMRLVEFARLDFRFYSGASSAAIDAIIALAQAGDERLADLRSRVYGKAAMRNEWSGWDIVAQAGEIAAGLGQLDEARRIFDLLVDSLESRFAADLPLLTSRESARDDGDTDT